MLAQRCGVINLVRGMAPSHEIALYLAALGRDTGVVDVEELADFT